MGGKAKSRKKRIGGVVAGCVVVFALAFVLAFSLASLTGCSSSDNSQGGNGNTTTAAQTNSGSSETREFTDSAGRTVEIPTNIERIAPSGYTAQQVLLTIAPDKMVGLASELTDDQVKIFGDEFKDKPVFGAFLGAKDTFNREAVASADPQIIIDTGEKKDGIADDLDNLQNQTGIPCVFIETTLSDYGDAYRTLGDLLGEQDRGNEIGDYLQGAYDQTTSVMQTIPQDQRARVAYMVGDQGTNAIAQGSYQGQVIDMVANNVVTAEKVSGKGDGNQISMEQMANWNPDYIIFQDQSVYDSAQTDPAWLTISGMQKGQDYVCPSVPWCWLNSPPTVNQMLGVQWLPRVLYPDHFSDSIQDVTRTYFKTMYNYDLSDDELNDILQHALPADQE